MIESDAMDLPPLPETAALIVVDVQQGLDDPVWGRRNNPDAEANIGRLLAAWRRTHRPIFHIQHRSRLATSPLCPGQRGFDLKEIVRPLPGEPLLTKEVNSAFIGTDLEERLRRLGCTTVVVTGLTTNHCVETTTRMAGNLDFTTFIVSDATATFDRIGPDGAHYTAELIHAVSLASLHGEFATVVTTETLLASLAQHTR
ncbi:MAG: cysteine hydrolase family protein [Thermomicrobiales bacterium]